MKELRRHHPIECRGVCSGCTNWHSLLLSAGHVEQPDLLSMCFVE